MSTFRFSPIRSYPTCSRFLSSSMLGPMAGTIGFRLPKVCLKIPPFGVNSKHNLLRCLYFMRPTPLKRWELSSSLLSPVPRFSYPHNFGRQVERSLKMTLPICYLWRPSTKPRLNHRCEQRRVLWTLRRSSCKMFLNLTCLHLFLPQAPGRFMTLEKPLVYH